jgi:hypothetical protein
MEPKTTSRGREKLCKSFAKYRISPTFFAVVTPGRVESISQATSIANQGFCFDGIRNRIGKPTTMLAAEAMKMAGTQFFVHQMSDSLTQIIQDDPRHRRAEEDGNHTRRLYCLPPGVATCYP